MRGNNTQFAGTASRSNEHLHNSVLRIKFVSDRLFISTWLLAVSDIAAPLRPLCK